MKEEHLELLRAFREGHQACYEAAQEIGEGILAAIHAGASVALDDVIKLAEGAPVSALQTNRVLARSFALFERAADSPSREQAGPNNQDKETNGE